MVFEVLYGVCLLVVLSSLDMVVVWCDSFGGSVWDVCGVVYGVAPIRHVPSCFFRPVRDTWFLARKCVSLRECLSSDTVFSRDTGFLSRKSVSLHHNCPFLLFCARDTGFPS